MKLSGERAACAFVVVALLLLGASTARAQATRRLRFAERGELLVVSGGFTDVFDARLLDRLDSGFETIILLRGTVHRSSDGAVVSVVQALYRVVYDLWDEVYLVRVEDPRGGRTHRLKTRAEALARATRMEELPIAGLARIAVGQHHYLQLTVEVNPLSQETLAEVRRWLARPASRESVAGESSVFGLIVSIFMNPKIDEAEAVLRIRSQPFFRVKR